MNQEGNMVVTQRRPEEVLALTRRQLGLPLSENMTSMADEACIASLVRHSAGFLCPCSPTTLRSAVRESLRFLIADHELDKRIDESIENLTVGGDLLELSHVTTNDEAVKGTWVFAAPPGFVIRPKGSIFLTGIVADQDTYFPRALSERIQYDGCTRMLVPDTDEDLAGELAELGLHHLSQDTWLKCPRAQPPEAFLSDLERRLRSGARSGDIPDLHILDFERPVTYYPSRWVAPKKHSGIFVARRPQQYGAPIWCFVELENGMPKNLLDFPLPKNRWRGCDTAWYLQAAIDRVRGKPQLYKRREVSQDTYLDFFSPLPLWAQRRLTIIGRKADPEKCLLSFRVPANELEEEERFLREQLWLSRDDATGGASNANNT